MEIRKNIDEETLISAENDRIRVDIVNIGEGVCGDYDPENPDDENLLRFDVYCKDPKDPADDWREVSDASYCTNLSADVSEEMLEAAVTTLFNEYDNVADQILSGSSVKRLGEQLSWISASDFEEPVKE